MKCIISSGAIVLVVLALTATLFIKEIPYVLDIRSESPGFIEEHMFLTLSARVQLILTSIEVTIRHTVLVESMTDYL